MKIFNFPGEYLIHRQRFLGYPCEYALSLRKWRVTLSYSPLKGTVGVISSDPPCKNLVQKWKWKKYLIHFRRETKLQMKTWISKSHLTDKAFKDTVVNRALSSLHGGSLKIMLTLPLRECNTGKTSL